MKNKIKVVSLLCILLIGIIFLSSCSGALTGTYVRKDADNPLNYFPVDKLKFQGDRVTVYESIMFECTYEIIDNVLIVEGSAGMIPYEREYEFSKSGNSIFLNGHEFIKE